MATKIRHCNRDPGIKRWITSHFRKWIKVSPPQFSRKLRTEMRSVSRLTIHRSWTKAIDKWASTYHKKTFFLHKNHQMIHNNWCSPKLISVGNSSSLSQPTPGSRGGRGSFLLSCISSDIVSRLDIASLYLTLALETAACKSSTFCFCCCKWKNFNLVSVKKNIRMPHMLS